MLGDVLRGQTDAELIQEIVLAAAGVFSFANIPQDYSSLLLLGSIRSSAGLTADQPALRFNGDAGANYDYNTFHISGTGVGSLAAAIAATQLYLGYCCDTASPASVFSPIHVVVPAYASPAAFKAQLSDYWLEAVAAVGSIGRGFGGGVWKSLAAITSILVRPITAPNTFVVGSRISLYALR